MEVYAVIMAGGGGTRFWPLSRQHMPKQLVNISGNDVMINETIKRLTGTIPLDNIYVVTNRHQKENADKLILSDLPRENILLEPASRNTAACINYAAIEISKRCPDGIMCVLPSDHFISDEEGFRKTLIEALNAAEETDKLITVGIKPTFPSTGYGYIRYNPEQQECINGAYEVSEFIEKPNIERARKYVESGSYLWNSGIFVWKLSTILDNLKRYLPRLYKSMMRIGGIVGAEKEIDEIESVYSMIESISIDFGVMERSDDVLVIPGDFGWNDLGSWDALGSVFPTDENGNIVRAKHICIKTNNSIIYSGDRLIATIGLDGMIIADTPDALLICPKNKAQDVKEMVELMKKRGLWEYI